MLGTMDVATAWGMGITRFIRNRACLVVVVLGCSGELFRHAQGIGYGIPLSPTKVPGWNRIP